MKKEKTVTATKATTKSRKKSHIDVALKHVVTNLRKTTGFEDVKLIYCALPELDFEKVDTSTTFLGKRISAPFMIDAITGGHPIAKKVNRDLAAAAEAAGIPFALGSQRAMIESPALKDTYYVRDVAPSIPIIGNIGAVNLKEKGMIDKVDAALKDVGADALAVHLNALQEVIQPEGDKNFEGCLAAISDACKRLDVPVIVKEVGFGINGDVARQLDRAGVAMINVAGAGGTSWSRLELLRGEGRLQRFADSGLPTVLALIDTLKATRKPVIVSGGVRSGVDIAKGIALGASYAAAALPFLQAWDKGRRSIDELIALWKDELRVTMFAVGAESVQELKRPLIIGRTAEFLRAWEKK